MEEKISSVICMLFFKFYATFAVLMPSSRFHPFRYAPGVMQGARFESGLDNSPMYDGEMFNVRKILSHRISVLIEPDGVATPPSLALQQVSVPPSASPLEGRGGQLLQLC